MSAHGGRAGGGAPLGAAPPPWAAAECRVLGREEPAPGYVRLLLEAPGLAARARPGQFLHVHCGHGREPLLRRPLSVHDADPAAGTVALLVRVVGRGTALIAGVAVGDVLDVLGPLGRGFDAAGGGTHAGVHASAQSGARADAQGGALALVAGGAGVAPLVFAARASAGRTVHALVGARTAAELVSVAELGRWGARVRVATDDGTSGHHGPVTDLLEDLLARQGGGRASGAVDAPCEVWACGPLPMLRRVAAIAGGAGVRCLVSLEAHMACGVGACRGCAWPAAGAGESAGAGGCATAPSYVHVCRDGPVFDAREVAL